MKAEDRKALVGYAREETYDSEVLFRYLKSLAEVVVSLHYSAFDYREDLTSVGIEKALLLLRAPWFDPTKNIRAYLYTNIRRGRPREA